jgi:hypothetical protein
MARILEVAWDQDRFAAFLLDKFFDFIRLICLVEEGDEDIGSLARVCDCHCPANAAVPARDNSFEALEAAGSFVALLAMIRARLHSICKSRHRLLLRRKRRLGIIR